MTTMAFDPNALAASVRPTTVQEASTRFANNPFIAIVEESFHVGQDNGQAWRGNQVPASQVRSLVAYLRNAGQQLAEKKIGVHIKYQFKNAEGQIVEIGDLRQVPTEGETPVNVKFRGAPARKYERNTATVTTSDTESDAEGEPETADDVVEGDDEYASE
jgi:hypothetical protein